MKTKKKFIQILVIAQILLWPFLLWASEERVRVDPEILNFSNASTGTSLQNKSLSSKASKKFDDGLYCGIAPSPDFFKFSQPNGILFSARVAGTSHYSWLESEKGNRIGKNFTTGYYEYMNLTSQGYFELSGNRVGMDTAPSQSKYSSKSISTSPQEAEESQKHYSPIASQQLVTRSGSDSKKLRQLVILVNFSDTNPTFSQQDFHRLYNDEYYSLYGARGSVKKYYQEVSYEKLEVETVVTPWVTLPQTRAYYGANAGSIKDLRSKEMILHAIEALSASGFDFSTFDSNQDGWIDFFGIIHQGRGEEAGGGEEAIWSHKWSLDTPIAKNGIKIQTYYTAPEAYYNEITTIGVICHEMGHFLGLPDLYDIDSTSAGIGRWGLMGKGSWNMGGKSPAHFSGWSKVQLGWINPILLTSSKTGVSLPESEKNPLAYILPTSMEGEYFLIENRMNTGFDEGLPGKGMLIWHIDETQENNNNEKRYRVGLVQADGCSHLEKNFNDGDTGDSWPGSTNALLFDGTTLPSSNGYSGPTGIAISNISPASSAMTFNLTKSGGEVQKYFTIYNDSDHNVTISSINKEVGISWIVCSFTTAFNLPPNSSQQIMVSIEGIGKNTGFYGETLLISTSDPENSLLRVKVYVNWNSETLTISGKIQSFGQPVPGVVLYGLPGNPTTDSRGFYSSEVPYGWSGVIRPEKAGYSMEPSSKSYSNVISHQSFDFNAFSLVQTSGESGSGSGGGGCSLSKDPSISPFEKITGTLLPLALMMIFLNLSKSQRVKD